MRIARRFIAGFPGEGGKSPFRDERTEAHFTRFLSPLQGLDGFVDRYPSDESMGYCRPSLTGLPKRWITRDSSSPKPGKSIAAALRATKGLITRSSSRTTRAAPPGSGSTCNSSLAIPISRNARAIGSVSDQKSVPRCLRAATTNLAERQAARASLTVRRSDGEIRWMDVTACLKRESTVGKAVKQTDFAGERFDMMSVWRWREKVLRGASPVVEEISPAVNLWAMVGRLDGTFTSCAQVAHCPAARPVLQQ